MTDAQESGSSSEMPQGGRVEAPDGQNRSTTPFTWNEPPDASMMMLPAEVTVNRLYRTAATDIFNGTPGTTITTYSFNSGSGTCVAGQSAPQTELGVFELSPYITPLTNYGFVFNAGLNPTNSCKPGGTLVTNPPGGTVQADPVTLVNSPIATACFACHDGDVESAHMQLNGGSLYEPRSTALAKPESCMICHGPGKIADIKVMHAP